MPSTARLRLQDACTIQVGYTARRRLVPVSDGGIAVIRLQDVQPGEQLDPWRLLRVQADEVSGKHLVYEGDVVFRSRGDQNTAVALNEEFREPALAILPLFVLRPKVHVILPLFLAWTINQPVAQHHFDKVAYGTNMRMISRSGLSRLEIDVPPMEAQRRIVAVDALARRERILSILAAERRRELIARLLGDLAAGTSPSRAEAASLGIESGLYRRELPSRRGSEKLP